jgi:hypothetical protein
MEDKFRRQKEGGRRKKGTHPYKSEIEKWTFYTSLQAVSV